MPKNVGFDRGQIWTYHWHIGSPMGSHESAMLPILVFQPSEIPF